MKKEVCESDLTLYLLSWHPNILRKVYLSKIGELLDLLKLEGLGSLQPPSIWSRAVGGNLSTIIPSIMMFLYPYSSQMVPSTSLVE